MWDQRYAAPGYAYGKEPNDFLRQVSNRIPGGRVLCLAEGEGRNAVYLAGLGCSVLAVDASAVGLEKALKLAAERKVSIETRVVDLAEFTIAPASFDAIVAIFCHLPPTLRALVHRQAVRGLRPGGLLALEGYAQGQLGRGTGGPQSAELLFDLATIQQELSGLHWELAMEKEREVVEGSFHTGLGQVIQLLGIKP